MDKPVTAEISLAHAARDAMSIVRQVAEIDTGKIGTSRHAKKQMSERDIVFRDLERVLRLGDHCTLEHPNPKFRPEFGSKDGEVKIVVTFKARGMREIAAATIVVTASKRIFVKTVMWSDER